MKWTGRTNLDLQCERLCTTDETRAVATKNADGQK